MVPSEALRQLRECYVEFKDARLSYAGRLDPMAEGLLLVLVGEENKNQTTHLSYDKEYEVEVLWSITTDSYDLLGKVTNHQSIEPAVIDDFLKTKLIGYQGELLQAYPPYSAVRVNGKPLFWWARHGRLSEITIPSRQRQIHKLTHIMSWQKNTSDLQEYILSALAEVTGDFRQQEIIALWQDFFAKNQKSQFVVSRLTMTCSSGTYVRSLIDQLGSDLGCGAVVLKLIRTKIGAHSLEDAVHLPSATV